MQEKTYSNECLRLTSTPPLSVLKGSPLRKLKPVMDDGLLRVGGRLSRSELPYESRHPIILPGESPVVRQYVRWRHAQLGHCGVDHLLNDLRSSLWIVKARSAVKDIVHGCTTCRRIDARPLSQEMSDLPKDRVVAGEPPFTRVGTDCFGPFIVRKGRTDYKRYGLVFTCLTTRAVHIEVLESLETDTFINGLRRFIARRGSVKVMRSDNGSNFVGAEKELRLELQKIDPAKTADAMSLQGIDWRFNPPYASHFGGVWERMIRSIRRILNGLLLQQRLTDEVLQTLMCEVEAILNSRPLTTLSDEPGAPRPLTPAHLLTLKGPGGPPCETTASDAYSKKRWRQVQYLADVFWRRWVREYLPSLQERSKWNDPKRNLQIGDLVLVVDTSVARCSWPLGKVVRVEPDESGTVRKAWVKTEKSEMLRPISKLCLILENDS